MKEERTENASDTTTGDRYVIETQTDTAPDTMHLGRQVRDDKLVDCSGLSISIALAMGLIPAGSCSCGMTPIIINSHFVLDWVTSSH